MKSSWTTVLATTLLAIAACGGEQTRDPTERGIARLATLADKLCACADAKCADGVMAEVATIKEPESKPTEAQMARAMKIAQRMGDCRQKLMTVEQPTPQPPPTPPTPPATP